jgi:hypothetical protein
VVPVLVLVVFAAVPVVFFFGCCAAVMVRIDAPAAISMQLSSAFALFAYHDSVSFNFIGFTPVKTFLLLVLSSQSISVYHCDLYRLQDRSCHRNGKIALIV